MAGTLGFNRRSDSITKNLRAPVQAQTSNTRVLVVEDHEDTRFMLKTMLEMRGLSVVEATDGEVAIAVAEREHPDLILMDGSLPSLDGFAATRRIRELASAREVPIVFLSGHAQPAVEARAFAAGCTDYLIKPFAIEKLGSVLERHLPQSKAF